MSAPHFIGSDFLKKLQRAIRDRDIAGAHKVECYFGGMRTDEGDVPIRVEVIQKENLQNDYIRKNLKRKVCLVAHDALLEQLKKFDIKDSGRNAEPVEV
jgi:hypothetical protein